MQEENKNENAYAKARESYNESHNDRITQEMVAEKCKCSRTTIFRIEKGETQPSIDILRYYHKTFNAPYEYLLGDVKNMETKNVNIGKELWLSDKAINNIRCITKNAETKKVLNHMLSADNLKSFLMALYYYWNISIFDVLDTNDFMQDTDISAKIKMNEIIAPLIGEKVSPKYAYAIKCDLERRIHQFLLDNDFGIDDLVEENK